jgi:putative modified peptide
MVALGQVVTRMPESKIAATLCCTCTAQPLAFGQPQAGAQGMTMAKNFSREVADKLLDKLSSDDKFREQFERNPRAALHQIGHDTPKELEGIAGSDPVMCLTSSNGLASKEQIRAARTELQEQLTGGMFHYNVVL